STLRMVDARPSVSLAELEVALAGMRVSVSVREHQSHCSRVTGNPEVIHHRSLSDGCPRFTCLEPRTLGPCRIIPPAFCLHLGCASIRRTLFPMDFSLNDHQKLIRDTVRQFMEAEVRPFVKEWEKGEKFPAEAIKKLGEMGCCGMLVPEEWGGPGLDTVSYVLMLEEVARVFTAMSTALGVTNSAVQAPLLLFGTEAQKKKYLRRMATGETLGAFCLTEPAAGSDAAGIQARAVRDGNVYKLNGTKTWVTNGSAAGVLIVFAKTD